MLQLHFQTEHIIADHERATNGIYENFLKFWKIKKKKSRF